MTDNPPIRIYVNKTENKTTFKISTGCYLELLTFETIKLSRSSKIKTNKDKNGKHEPL